MVYLISSLYHPVLPIGSSTLCYGSNDGGLTVLKKEDVLCQKIQQACEWLHLKDHVVGNGVSLYGPGTFVHPPQPHLHDLRSQSLRTGDLEGHKGKDGRYYVVGKLLKAFLHHSQIIHECCRSGTAVPC